ncbi:MAG: hypothetical protein JSW49_01280, partial [candidate division WOR-3 bacterium]
AALNLVLFLLHRQAYKSAGYSLRRSWAAVTIGAGCGAFITWVPEWLYGQSSDHMRLLVAIVIWITGITMALVSRKSRRSTTGK